MPRKTTNKLPPLGPSHIVIIYGQPFQHASAEIAGTPEGLERLCEVIARALTHGRGSTQVLANDGESYQLDVLRLTEEQLDKKSSHYFDLH